MKCVMRTWVSSIMMSLGENSVKVGNEEGKVAFMNGDDVIKRARMIMIKELGGE